MGIMQNYGRESREGDTRGIPEGYRIRRVRLDEGEGGRENIVERNFGQDQGL